MKYKILIASLIFVFSLTSCNLFFSFNDKNTKYHQYNLEVESINFYDAGLIRDETPFVTDKSIAHNKDYVYTVTSGEKDFPGYIIKTNKKTLESQSVCLYEKAIEKGYSDTECFWILSVNLYGDNLFVEASRDLLVLENGTFEVFCLDPSDLSIKWRWIPEENHSIFCLAGGDNILTFWKDDLYIHTYVTEYQEKQRSNNDKPEHFWLVIIDGDGKTVAKREFCNSWPLDEGEFCILGDTLFLHQSKYPVVMYDLNRICDESYSSEDCIIYSYDQGKSLLYTACITDGKNVYFNSFISEDVWTATSNVVCMDIETKNIIWKYPLTDIDFQAVDFMTVYENKLLVPVDYGCVYCFETSTGELLWETKVVSGDDHVNLMQKGCIYRNTFCLPCYSDSTVYFFDLNTGNIDGIIKLPLDNTAYQCFVEDDYLYITEGWSLYRIKVKDK